MTSIFRRIFSGSLFFALALALGLLPNAARGQLFGRSTARDVQQGAEVAKMVEQQIGLYEQPEAQAYLRNVGARLTAAASDSRWNFTFQIADQDEPNAFAIPGGGIYISRGLLALVRTEDELAGVLGHEIAHVTERHSAQQQRKGFLPGLLSLPGNVVGSVLSENLGALINAPIEAVGGAWMSRYSRGQESEADRIGIQTAAKAGYDPAALADILARMERVVNSQTGEERRFNMFDSHPMTDTRLRDIRSRASKLTAASAARVATNPAALFAKLDGMWWGDNPEQGVFKKNQFLQPSIGFTLTLPAGWKNGNTPQYLISVHPQQEAMLLLGVAGRAADPKAVGQRFVALMRSKARIELVSARESSLGEFPAFVATYLDRSGRTPTYLHFLWVAMAGKTYQLVGLAPEKYRETLRDSAVTLRPLTDAERSTVTGKRLRLATAHPGERVENLGARTGNAWTPAFTALVNDLAPDAPLNDGQLIRIAREEPLQKTTPP